METVSTNIAGVSQEQIYKEFLRLGMEQLIAQDLSKRYYHNELTYRDLENLEKQFDIKFDNLIFKIDNVKNELNTKIDNVEKNLQKDISNLDIKIDNVEKNLNLKIDSLDTKIDTVEKNLNAKIDNVEKNLNAKIDNVEKNLMSLSEMLKWVLGIMGAMSITMIAGLIFAFISK
ncbi:KID repeat family protein (plasmid) [Borreliella bissettiae DN127]|uniref:KID repeat family protein n=1 Tax=Borrelia bissettiae (strain DSM 17990 / CIP 109136 / DN127) TaxID=521010 RepID=G0ANJ9_BORBD|nr:Bdr family repetitive protein [Borreliella bissettiae]AEL19275.1 KID repeat family protein [Borreliella bissettiae DN127]